MEAAPPRLTTVTPDAPGIDAAMRQHRRTGMPTDKRAKAAVHRRSASDAGQQIDKGERPSRRIENDPERDIAQPGETQLDSDAGVRGGQAAETAACGVILKGREHERSLVRLRHARPGSMHVRGDAGLEVPGVPGGNAGSSRNSRLDCTLISVESFSRDAAW